MKENLKGRELWNEFCEVTNREYHWAIKSTSLLNSFNLLPTDTILDVGCGTGVFTSCFKNHCTNIIGIDNVDHRTIKSFEFRKEHFESYGGPKPNLLIFKQSFHLIPNVWDIIAKYPDSTILVLQAPKPIYVQDDEVWLQEPYSIHANADKFVAMGREVILKNEFLEILLKTEFYEKLVKGGYSFDLQNLTKKERTEIWDSLSLPPSDILFKDDLDILLVR